MGKTARRLNISTGSVSQRLLQLEKYLGGELAIRTTHHMELTDLGRALHAEATAILQLSRAAESRLKAQASGSTGRLHLSYIGSVGPFILPGLVRQASELIPGMTIEIGSQGFAAKIEELLLTQQSDLGISRSPVRSRLLDWKALYDDPLILMVPENHHLASRQEIDLREVRNETHIVFPKQVGSIIEELGSAMYEEAGYYPQKRVEVTETLTALGLVGSRVGVSIMPESTRHIGVPGVRYVPLKNQVTTQVVIAWRRSDSNQLRARFISELEAAGRFISTQ